MGIAPCFSQTQPLLELEKKKKIVLHGNAYAASNAITNELTGKLFLGGFIDEAIKDNISEKLLLKDNRFGFELDYGVSYYSNSASTFGIGGMSWYGGIFNRSIINTNFPRDIFELTFRGNKTFAGSTASIGKFNLNAYTFQQIQAGVIFDHEGESGTSTTLNVGAALLKGQNYISMNINRGSLFTESNGEYLDIRLDMDAAFSDTSQSGLAAFNGIGGAFNIGLHYLSEKIGGVQLEISDIGFIRWNKKSHQFNVDSSYHFEGIEVNNIFNAGGLALNIRDSLPDYLGVKSERTSVLSLLPLKVRLMHKIYLSQIKSELSLGLQQIFFNANYTPLVFARLNYRSNSYWQVMSLISWGGYSKLNAGLALVLDLPGNFNLYLHSDYIIESLLAKHPATKGLYIKLTKEFN